jgi:hypothetical protein
MIDDNTVAKLLATIDKAREKRAVQMPDEHSALQVLFIAWLRLRDLGWKEACYCPKDGTPFKIIQAGSTGIFDAHYSGQWPDGYIVSFDGQEVYCSRPGGPILFKSIPEAKT